MRLEAVLALEIRRLLHELIDGAHLVAAVGVGISKEEIRSERHTVAEATAEHLGQRNAPLLSEYVETGELQCGENLCSIVVERRSGVGDEESHFLETSRVAADQIT